MLGALFLAVFLGMERRRATTVAFLTLALAQLWHVFSMRHRASGPWRNEITTNPWIWAALALCVALLLAAVYLPPLAALLSTRDPGWLGWGVAVGTSLVPLAVGQVALAVRGRGERRALGSARS